MNTGQHTGKCARFRRVFIPETVLLGGVQCSECARTGGEHKWNGESLTASTTGAQNRSYFCVPLGPRGLNNIFIGNIPYFSDFKTQLISLRRPPAYYITTAYNTWTKSDQLETRGRGSGVRSLYQSNQRTVHPK